MKPAPSENASTPRCAGLVPVLLLLSLRVLASCSTLPEEDTFRSYYQAYERRVEMELAELQRQRDAGEITESGFQIEADKLREDFTEKVNDAIYRDYQLRRSSREPLPPTR